MGAHARLDVRLTLPAPVEAEPANHVGTKLTQAVRLLALVTEGHLVIEAEADQEGDFVLIQAHFPQEYHSRAFEIRGHPASKFPRAGPPTLPGNPSPADVPDVRRERPYRLDSRGLPARRVVAGERARPGRRAAAPGHDTTKPCRLLDPAGFVPGLLRRGCDGRAVRRLH